MLRRVFSSLCCFASFVCIGLFHLGVLCLGVVFVGGGSLSPAVCILCRAFPVGRLALLLIAL